MITHPIIQHDVRGSLWHRWDLHFHTPSSFDYDDNNITNNQIVECLIENQIRVVAITDHHVMDVSRLRELQRIGNDRLTVLPGIELRDDHGGDPIHYICIFPDDCNLDHVWTTLQGSLGLTTTAIRDKGGDEKIYVPIEEGAKQTRDLGGVVSIHAEVKSNSIEGIKNKEEFQQRIKYDITKMWIDLMEIGQFKDIDIHQNIIFPKTGLQKPLIICSDNHKITEYSVKMPLWFRTDPTFRGLLMVLREPCDRVYIGVRPEEIIRVEQNPTKYIRSVSFQRKVGSTVSEKWFNGSIIFNTGLVTIVGNKGSGKSALADTLGLLGATKNSGSFSFLNKDRFLHSITGHAKHFEATIEWESDEKVCNEIAGVGEEGFEKELKSVIFSHVPEVKRIGHSSLDELVRFQTGEKQKRIDSLFMQLREISRSRAILEAQADPANRRELLERIKRRELELEAHDKTKPIEKPNPNAIAGRASSNTDLLQELEGTEKLKTVLSTQINNATDTLRTAERRHAIAKLLIEKLDNFEKDFNAFKDSLTENAVELSLSVDDLVALSIKRSAPEKIRDEESTTIISVNKQLDDVDPPGLRQQVIDVEKRIAKLQLKLDAPNRDYKTYLKDLKSWQEKREKIEGSKDDPESLRGLQAALAAVDDLPSKIDELKEVQIKLAL
ncbi:MAG: PHP N-terminal domain protein [Candidatus Jettenia ecosi]|uniref:PHP N-terminal domain protein n=1 Tax=Candidatus Jettenia ecosi TaxID=2494326 RepID=A0A533QE58_9BACT|nr:MAG: PHP N-terminal domain protein [Candidatus Jettenia ecosi]